MIRSIWIMYSARFGDIMKMAGAASILTDSQATRLKFDNGLLKQYSSYGKAPHLAARGEADIRIALKGDFTLYSCDTAGKRLAEVPLSKEPDGTIRFQAKVFRPEGSVFVYELVRN